MCPKRQYRCLPSWMIRHAASTNACRDSLGSAETGCDAAAMRLMVLDDDAAVGRLVSRVARTAGYEPVTITDASMMPASLSQERPAVVVLDLQLGQDDGLEQLRVLAARHFEGALILISGFNARVLAVARSIAEDLGLRVAAALCKPLRLSELKDVLQRIRASHHSVTAERVLEAIRARELRLHLQPIVRRSPKRLCRLAARPFWMHPERGMLPELAFMPIAETSHDLAHALTEWLVDSAAESYRLLNGMALNTEIAVSPPILSLTDRLLPERIGSQLQLGRMPPAALWLEVNAGPTSLDVSSVSQQLARLRLKNVRLSLAEFGTSACCLSLLRGVPFCDVKIGRALIRDLGSSSDAAVIVESIVGLAGKMGMDTVATGVETELAAHVLENLGIGGLQGRLIGEPMPVEQVPAWLGGWMSATQAPQGTAADEVMASSAQLRSARDLAESAADGVSDIADAEAAARRLTLSGRQLDVIQLLAEGRSVKGIAQALGLSIGTVKVHLSRAYAALGAHNRVEAIIKAGYMDQSERSEPSRGS